MDCLMMSFSKELQQNLLCRFFRWSSVQTAGCVFKEKRNLPYGTNLGTLYGYRQVRHLQQKPAAGRRRKTMSGEKLIIAIQYHLTVSLANQLIETASGIEGVSSGEIEETRNSINACWNGDNSQKYLYKLNTLETKITTNARGLRRSAETIKTMAGNIYRAELRAIDLVKTRKH